MCSWILSQIAFGEFKYLGWIVEDIYTITAV